MGNDIHIAPSLTAEDLHDDILTKVTQSTSKGGSVMDHHLPVIAGPSGYHIDTSQKTCEISGTTVPSKTCKVSEAQEKLEKAYNYLQNLIPNSEPSLLESIIKFSKRLQEVPTSRLPSALFEFGKWADGVE